MDEPLTSREEEVARAYALGGSYKTVARDLGISPSTVRAHLGTIYRKLRVDSKVALANALREADPEPDCAAPVLVVSLEEAQAALQSAEDRHLAFFERELERREALMAELMAERDAQLATELSVMQAEIAALRGKMADPEQASKGRAETEARIRAQLEREANSLGADRIAEAEAVMGENFEKADALFAEIEAAQALEVEKAARAAFARGEIAAEEVRWIDAADHFDRAARLSPTYDRLLQAGIFTWRAGRHKIAVAHEEALLELARSDYGPKNERTVRVMANLAASYASMGRYAEAEPMTRDVLKAAVEISGRESAEYASSVSALAVLLEETGRHDEAEPFLHECLDIRLKVLGEDHVDYARSLSNLGAHFYAKERYEEAEPLLRRAADAKRAALGEAHPDYAMALNSLGALLHAMGRTDEALPFLNDAISITRTALGDRHPSLAVGLHNFSRLLCASGRFDEAEPLQKDALQLRQGIHGDGHFETELSRAGLADLYAKTERLPEALPMMRQAVEGMTRALGPDHPMTTHFQGELVEMESKTAQG